MEFAPLRGAHRKRTLRVRHSLIGVAVLLLVAACGSSSKDSDPPKAAATSGAANVAALGTVDDLKSATDFCGTKDVTIAYVDSWAGVNAWRKITKAEFADEASKCPNVKVIYTDGQGSLQKTISDVKSVTAQGVDGIVVMFADFGKSLLPAATGAMKAGIPVAGLLGAGIGGEQGTDYVANVYADEIADAKVRTAWLVKQLGGSGKIIDVGGTPGNPLSAAVFEGVKQALQESPGVELLNPSGPIDTNFDPAAEQKAVAGALAKYPEINGVQNECGTCAPGGFRAFQTSGRPLVPWVSDDNNEVSCAYYELKETNPKFEIMTTAARNWLSRVALHYALASAEGIDISEPQVYTMPVVEDSTDPDLQPKCVKDAPPGAIFSSLLPDAEVIDTVK
jgi:ribose transport system substrate-binding protein